MGDTYPCLSIRQPWVWAIFHAGKDIENRDWPTRFRGRILVHAAKGMTRAEYEDCLDTVYSITDLELPPFDALPRGCIYGGVTITDCVPDSASLWFGGRYGFALADPKPLAVPIPYKGALGIFQVAAAVLSGGDHG